MTLNEARGWMTPIIRYLIQNKLIEEEREAKCIRRISARYLIVADHLYKMGRPAPMLRCISEEDSIFVMKEVHEGVCGIHLEGRELSGKILRAGYYWPSMLQDCA